MITQARQPGHAVGAHPAAPAVEAQRLCLATSGLREGLREISKAWAAKGQSELNGGMATLLLVGQANVMALLVCEKWNVDGAWPMSLTELLRGANVNQRTCRCSECLDTGCGRDAHA